jgi:hypothetical protein
MFARHLSERGHEVTVVCSEPANKDGILIRDETIRILRIRPGTIASRANRLVSGISNEKGRKGQTKKFEKLRGERATFSKAFAVLRWIKGHGYYLLREMDWLNQAKKKIGKECGGEVFDVVFSTFPPLGPLLLGNHVRRRGISRLWITDMRDHILDDLYPDFANRFYGILARNMLHKCDLATVVSEGQRLSLLSDSGGMDAADKIAVITNGYVDAGAFPADDNRILDISYIGNLYGGYRDLRMLFEAIGSLIDRGDILAEKVRIHYAGEQAQVVEEQIAEYGLSGLLVNHGYLKRRDSLELQGRSDVLVVLSWNTETERGVMPGKFYEYLAFRKPIVSICAGPVPGAELTSRVEAYRVGIGCEYCRKEADLPRLAEFLKRVYMKALDGDVEPWDYDMEKVSKHEYGSLASDLTRRIGAL